jgi:signal transduction histidine kinase
VTSPAFDLASAGHDHDPFFDTAARIAAQIASPPDEMARRASFLTLDGDVLTAVAEYDETGETFRGRYELSQFPNFQRAVVSGEIQVIGMSDLGNLTPAGAAVVTWHQVKSCALVPVISGGTVAGVIAVSARDDAGFSDSQVRQLVTLAQLVGLRVSHVASDQPLRDEAERSHGLERLKGEFLNIAAHELRSPLGIINGYVSMLLDGTLTGADQRKALERIAEKSDEMTRLITEMLETARMEALGLDLTLAPTDLMQVLDEAIQAIKPLLGSGHRFATRGRRDPLPVIADHDRAVTMMVNLLDNAVKYSPGGGDIQVAWTRRAGVCHISVTDHGVGISREQQSMLFTRFGRLVTPATSHIRGTGLGLYIAREIARLHGGDIAVRSEVGRGTTFTITMPLDPGALQTQAPEGVGTVTRSVPRDA